MVDSPNAPDPTVQAQAQGAANREAAISAGLINNVDEVGPYGNVTYTEGGGRSYINDAGETVNVPTSVRTTTLSDAQQQMLDRSNQAGINLGDLAVSQSGKLNDLLGAPMDTSTLPERPGAAPELQRVSQVGGTQRYVSDAGDIQRDVNLQNDRPELGYTGGGPQRVSGAEIGDAGQIQRGVADPSLNAVEAAYMGRANVDIDRQQDQMETKLMNQGITPGSDAWNTRMDEINRRRTDTRDSAILAGGAEQSRQTAQDIARGQFANVAQGQQYSQNQSGGLFDLARMAAENTAQGQEFDQYGQARGFEREGINLNNMNELARAGFANAAQAQKYGQNLSSMGAQNAAQNQVYGQGMQTDLANNQMSMEEFAAQTGLRDSALAEAYAARSQPINEITALMSGSQVTNPQFQGPYSQGVAAAQPAQYAMDAYMQKSANNNARNAGLFSLGNTAISTGGQAASMFAMSDRRTKTNIVKMGKTRGGMQLYNFNYKHGGPTITGVMAQDMPDDAVVDINGVLHVDYMKVA